MIESCHFFIYYFFINFSFNNDVIEAILTFRVLIKQNSYLRSWLWYITIQGFRFMAKYWFHIIFLIKFFFLFVKWILTFRILIKWNFYFRSWIWSITIITFFWIFNTIYFLIQLFLKFLNLSIIHLIIRIVH